MAAPPEIGSALRRTTLFRRQDAAAPADPGGTLVRSLGRVDLIAMGVGAIVGAGIFVTTGVAAATKAGPAIVLSFVLAGAICVLVALCYSELASMTPVSGSAYTYTYATMGEVPAFLVGWNLLLEYAVAAAAVAIGWSGLFGAALNSLFGVTLPVAITAGPGSGGIVNLPAVLIVAALVAVLVFEVKVAAAVVKILVAVTIGVLVLVVAVGAPHLDAGNWTPFTPFGVNGIAAGAALAFFAYLGFDIVATSAEETRNPRRDLPWGIIGSVVVATVLYVAVSAVLTGVAPYSTLNNAAPVATALAAIGAGWIGKVILVASVIALTKGLLMLFYGQTRLVFAMSRDGLVPKSLSRTGSRGVPVRLSLILGAAVAVVAGLLPIDTVAELVNIGALFAFVVVALGVMLLRRTDPDRPRPFRVPLMPLVPIAAIAGCVWLATTFEALTWLRFLIWSAAGAALYLTYGRTRSVAGRDIAATGGTA
ncbi:APA family basic amino acid/polyamine antiporter [Nocardia transvalensis]|uniref:APA family basic amino acid/polyamine antiporter n=1 Tax=Nocardia transvalensis TaxID=37333 RepID=A0A7W9PJ38_9NOCA|nr:amino acid permease [Nocardia transvalensis]MBB5917111.1 APA family basic amino acid/polyamine antiporter [Nocardia transvalensis]